MAIRFLTDSASDILPDEAHELGISLIPLTVTIDGTEYKDAVDMTHREFYEMLPSCGSLPTTSQVTPGEYTEKLEQLTANGDTVIIITLSSQLSGTYQSACIAAEDYPGKVIVIDSENACIGQRLLVLRGLELLAQGLDAQTIAHRLNAEKKSIRVLAVLDTLEYLKKGGRISAATAFAGELLSIKPVIAIEGGAVALRGKARGSKNSGNLLRKMIGEGGGVDFDRPFCLAYSGTSDEGLQRYIADHTDLWQTGTRQLPIVSVGSVIGTHVGPGAIAVAFFEK